MSHSIAPCHAAAPTPPIDASAITASEVATMLRADSSVKRVSAGTMTKPPPTPSSPLSRPAATPVSASACAQGRVHTRRPSRASSTHGSGARARGARGLQRQQRALPHAPRGQGQHRGERDRQRRVGHALGGGDAQRRQHHREPAHQHRRAVAHDAVAQAQRRGHRRGQAHGQQADRRGLRHAQVQREHEQRHRQDAPAGAGEREQQADERAEDEGFHHGAGAAGVVDMERI